LEPLQAVSDAILPWIIRIAGLFWLIGALMLFRQIRAEMALDRMTAAIEAYTRDLDAERAEEAWTDRDDAARRGWIAGQAVVLAATAIAMMLMHPFASWMVALLVLGQGVYFLWREHTARKAPSPEAAAHARPSKSTVNAGWFSLAVAMLVWAAAFRGLLR
jgi:hypothetical protein